MNKLIILFCYIFVISYSEALSINASYDYPDPNSSEEDIQKNQTDIKCKKMKFYCESCSDLVMCIDTEYGFTKQYVTCQKYSSCLRDKCTQEKNPLCDGTADIAFKCHVPGIFPDPFDCKKYHFCVPKSTKMVNGSLNLVHFDHSCQEDNGIDYMYDPLSRYCKTELENGCHDWPVPLCNFEGQTGALEENKSIFYVCDLVERRLYPHLYSCPHGEEYNQFSTKCEKTQIIIDRMPMHDTDDFETQSQHPYWYRHQGR